MHLVGIANKFGRRIHHFRHPLIINPGGDTEIIVLEGFSRHICHHRHLGSWPAKDNPLGIRYTFFKMHGLEPLSAHQVVLL